MAATAEQHIWERPGAQVGLTDDFRLVEGRAGTGEMLQFPSYYRSFSIRLSLVSPHISKCVTYFELLKMCECVCVCIHPCVYVSKSEAKINK